MFQFSCRIFVGEFVRGEVNRGERAIAFIQNLRHSKGEWAGKRLVLEQWQKDFLLKLFGTVRSDGLRQYRNSLLFLPRKNAKSTMAAAICLFLLIADGEMGAEIYSAANEREQASLVFNEAAQMVRQDKTLSRLCRIVDSRKTIFFPKTNSFYRAISADAASKHGFNASAVVVDEYHQAKSSELADVLETSMAARREPLMLTLTTAGQTINSPCGRLYQHACKVRDGLISDPSFLPLIFEAPNGSNPFEESTWKIANPNYGISVKPDYIKEKSERAKLLPTELNKFLRLHLNCWVGGDGAKFLPQDHWAAAGKIAVDLESLRGQAWYGGLDLASTTDVAALSLVTQHEGRWVVVSRFWIPKDTAYARGERDRVSYLTWAQQGFITLTDGNVIDYDVIRRDINELRQQFNIREIAVDRWNATQITTQLEGDGMTIIPFGQGFASMSAPTKELEKAVVSEKLLHGDNPVLNWMASNATAEIDAAGNVKISKKRSSEKVDGIVALAMAIGRSLSQGSQQQYSGLLTL